MSFRSDWREGAVFSWLICGGNRSSTEGGKKDHRPPTGLRGNQIEIRKPGFPSKTDAISIYCALKTDY
jgi:hypothetical protein